MLAEVCMDSPPWLGVSEQWLRYGSGAKMEAAAPLAVQQTGLVVLGTEYAGITPYAGIVPLLDKLVRLSPRDIHLVEGLVQLMFAQQGEK